LLDLGTNLSGANSDARDSHALVQIGVVVAEIAKSSYRLNILEMFAALLLLSAAGIGIDRLLAPTWHYGAGARVRLERKTDGCGCFVGKS
jgi:hypothetical protein